MNSWALDADAVVCTKEEGAPPPLPAHCSALCPLSRPLPHPLSLWHTAMSLGKAKQRRKEQLSIQADALSTLYFLWAESRGLASSSVLFLPSFLPSLFTSIARLVMSLLPPCCGVTERQRLLFAASPVDTVVMSLPPGTLLGVPALPDGLQRWGVEGGGESRAAAPSLASLPLSSPRQRSLTED